MSSAVMCLHCRTRQPFKSVTGSGQRYHVVEDRTGLFYYAPCARPRPTWTERRYAFGRRVHALFGGTPPTFCRLPWLCPDCRAMRRLLGRRNR